MIQKSQGITQNLCNLITRREALKMILCSAVVFIPGVVKSAESSDMLIIYFSHSGNTKAVAQEIQSLTHATIAEIKPGIPFPTNYDELVRVAEKEAADNARPKFDVNLPQDIDKYNLIFLGFPIWAYTMPMIIYSFLDQYKFPGKKIAPFSTQMGSGLADAPQQIAHLCPKAEILKGLAVRGTNAFHSMADVKRWLTELGVIK